MLEVCKDFLKACLDYMICRADFVMYDFVMHDVSVYTGITNHLWFLFPSAFIHENRKLWKIILLFRYVSHNNHCYTGDLPGYGHDLRYADAPDIALIKNKSSEDPELSSEDQTWNRQPYFSLFFCWPWHFYTFNFITSKDLWMEHV